MIAILADVAAKKKLAEQSAEQQAAAELVRLAKEQGLSLTGSDGLIKQLTKTVIETALAEELTEHLGYEKHDPAGAGSGTSATAPGARRCSRRPPVRSRSRCPAGSGRHVRAAAREEAAASAGGCRPGRAVPLREGSDDR